MGDRTFVCLTVQAEHHLTVLEIYKDYADHSNITHGKEFSYFDFHDVNYGNLIYLDKLEELGIAFDSEWEAGAEYGAGIDFCRFTSEGDVQRQDLEHVNKNPSLEKLLTMLDEPEALKKYILDHERRVTPLPWHNQVKYGQLYRAKQLITT